MGKVGTGFSMSLDGFIAGPGDDVQQVFKWYGCGDTEFRFPGGDRWVMKVSRRSADLLQETVDSAGALVTGRRQFDNTNGWDGRHPLDVPVFVENDCNMAMLGVYDKELGSKPQHALGIFIGTGIGG